MGTLPRVEPMKGVSGALPTDDGWAFEIKRDGMRVVAEVDDVVTAQSTNRLEVADRFPELQTRCVSNWRSSATSSPLQ